MQHPGISSYQYGTCMGNQGYFLRLMRRFKQERVSFAGLIEDLTSSGLNKRGVVPVAVEKPRFVDVSILKNKYKVRDL